MSGQGLAVLTKDFDHFFCEAHSDVLADIDEGNRIEIFLHLDVTIGMDFGCAPLA